MNYLTTTYWKNFKKDGKLFEQLSKTLIEYEYNVKDFVVIGGPGDGGKDIYKEIELLNNVTTEIWAQCKYHSKSLSFDDISFTLLMAYLKNTNQILIFSYSKVTKTFTDNLNEYRVKTGKNVIIYSDEDLETLILKHRTNLYKYHKEYFESFPNDQIYQSDKFEYDYQIYIDDNRVSEEETSINLNSICELAITITNKSSKEKTVRLECIKNQTSRLFEFLEGIPNNTYTIMPNNSKVFKIYVKPNKYVSETVPPSFNLITDNKKIRIQSKKKLCCVWLANTTLIGDKYYNDLKKINTGIKNPHFHLIYVYGVSGIGKTRMLKEAETQAIRSKKKIIYIDSEKKNFSCKKFLEILCSKITELPLFKENVEFISNIDKNTINYAAKILYDNNYNIAEEWETVAKFLTYTMSEKKYVLALDNLQHFDALSLNIIEYLITYLINSKSESTILFGINIDYIYKNSAFDEFFFKLKYSSANNPVYYTGIEIQGFENIDSELFIRECLTYRPDDVQVTEICYEQAVRKMANYCGNNPFYIQQYLLYLIQKKIIRRGDSTLYYIYNLDEFLNSFLEIPKSIEELIIARETFLTENENEDFNEKYRCLIYLINLTKALPKNIYYDIFGGNGVLDVLINMGFLSSTDGQITPVHSYYATYFNSKYDVDGIPRDLLEQFVASTEKLLYTEELALPYFWAKYRMGIINIQDLVKVITNIKSGHFDCMAHLFCIKSICKAIEKNCDMFTAPEYLSIYECLCSKIDETTGIKESTYYYEKFVDRFIRNINLFLDIAEESISLITHYLIHLVNKEEYDYCMEIINDISLTFNLMKKEDQLKAMHQINRCKIMIYNRNDQVSDAIAAALYNIEILNHEKMDSVFRKQFLYGAKRSVGNTYFYSTAAYQKRAEIVDSWNDSFNSYVEDYGFDTDGNFNNQPKVSAFAKGLAADIISGNEKLADQKAQFFVNAFDKMNMLYYEMQIRLLFAIYLIWKYSDSYFYTEHLNEINHYIDQAIDIAAIYGRELTTINAFHLKAVAFYISKNYACSADNYCIAADMLTKYLQSEKDYNRWDYFWADFARALRKANKELTVSFKQRYNPQICDKIQEILEMRDDEFTQYEEDYCPITALTDKNYIVNFPKI